MGKNSLRNTQEPLLIQIPERGPNDFEGRVKRMAE